jgi:hypothetical protein
MRVEPPRVAVARITHNRTPRTIVAFDAVGRSGNQRVEAATIATDPATQIVKICSMAYMLNVREKPRPEGKVINYDCNFCETSVARIKRCNHSPSKAALCQAGVPPDENSRMSRRITLHHFFAAAIGAEPD